MINGMIPVTFDDRILLWWCDYPAAIQEKIRRIRQEKTPGLEEKLKEEHRVALEKHQQERMRVWTAAHAGNPPGPPPGPAWCIGGGAVGRSTSSGVPTTGTAPPPQRNRTASAYALSTSNSEKRDVKEPTDFSASNGCLTSRECPDSDECYDAEGESSEKSFSLAECQETQTMLKAAGHCDIGFVWIEQSYGWRCAGGQHFLFKDVRAADLFADGMQM
ncbi:MAG: hypothetical protein Q9170_005972 [Blastenia crenularia]